MLDCQWLQQLQSYGLLHGAFRPSDGVCALRSFMRQRHALLRTQARSVQHMQKALVQMNLQLTSVIADVVGATGQAIVRAINAGERDPWKLAALRNCRIKASETDIALALQGNWRHEHLFALRQALAAFDFCGQQLTELDAQIEAQLGRLHISDELPAKGRRRSIARNAPKFDLRTRLFQMCGVDLTRVDGIDVTTALAVVSETGADLSRFRTSKHFASWLRLSPGTKISGGKTLSGRTLPSSNRAAQAPRLAAAALRTSQSALGAYYRRLCARMDRAKAVTAAAHKLARLIYAMLTRGEEYADQGQAYYEERLRQGALPGPGQEYGAADDAVRAGQFMDGAPAVARSAGMSAPARRPGTLRGLETGMLQGAERPTQGAAGPSETRNPAQRGLMRQKRGFADAP